MALPGKKSSIITIGIIIFLLLIYLTLAVITYS